MSSESGSSDFHSWMSLHGSLEQKVLFSAVTVKVKFVDRRSWKAGSGRTW